MVVLKRWTYAGHAELGYHLAGFIHRDGVTAETSNKNGCVLLHAPYIYIYIYTYHIADIPSHILLIYCYPYSGDIADFNHILLKY